MSRPDAHPLPPVVIGIAGGSGSGKTTVAERVREQAPGRTVAILHHDSYYRDNSHLPPAERTQINYDHPQAFETELLVRHLEALRAGETVDVPVYDYATHSRTAVTRRVEPADIVFVEGILVLENEALRELMDIRLYVDVDADERLIRRLTRDISERGRSLESVVRQYREVVRPMHLQFCEPSKRHAHLIIPEGGHNRVAIDLIVSKINEILRARHGGREERPAAVAEVNGDTP
ncbi:MAG TPA: uridine kinase [Candidatus Krumholzibacteria bacterium]|nr:uridine kinase [Candidatus Krumholzibacteria bacterium]HPD70872.1 uridine kinase [Candidatus Krumholzibacteria bacterium]HRY39428.1 uridine kinase [Candidatus Krumholzibacteria bacterium]